MLVNSQNLALFFNSKLHTPIRKVFIFALMVSQLLGGCYLRLSLSNSDSEITKNPFDFRFVQPRSLMAAMGPTNRTVAEGSSLSVEISISEVPSTDTSLQIFCRNALNPVDPRVPSEVTTTIGAGQNGTIAIIPFADDSVVQGEFTPVVCNLVAAGFHQDVITIDLGDNESAPVLSFDLSSQMILETTASAIVDVRLSLPSSQIIKVEVLPSLSSSLSYGVHHLFLGQQIEFAAGETLKTISVPILQNNFVTGNYNLELELLNSYKGLIATPYQSVLEIVDTNLTPQFNLAAASLSEKNGNRLGLWPTDLANWSHRKRFKFYPSNTTTLGLEGIKLTLSSQNINYSDFKADGSDLRVRSTDGLQDWPLRIEKWDTNGDSVVWVYPPIFIGPSGGLAYFDLYYGNLNVGPPTLPLVFSSDLLGYWDGSGLKNLANLPFPNLIQTNGNFVTGFGGQGLELNKSTGYFAIPHDSSLNQGTFSISYWVKLSSFGSTFNWRVLALKQGVGANRTLGMFLTSGTNSQVHYSFSSGGTYRSFNSLGSIPLNSWTHLAMVYDGSTLKLFLNGVLDSSNAATGTPDYNTEALYLGAKSPTTSYDGTTGVIDEIRFYKTARTAQEIKLEYDLSMPGAEPLNNTFDHYESVTNLKVQIPAPISRNLTIPFSVTTPDASQPTDYFLTSGFITILAGQVEAKLPLQIMRDADPESVETLNLEIQNPSEGILGSISQSILSIENFENTPPTAVNDNVPFAAETATLIDVLGNDTDIDGDILEIQSVTSPSFGVVSFTKKTITYKGQLFHPGSETLTYTISDGEGGTHSALVTLNLDPNLSFFWTGATGDGNWDTSGNWANGMVPSSTSIVHFDGGLCSGAQCNVNIQTSKSVSGLRMYSNFTGTINQNASLSILGNGFYQKAGTYLAPNSRLTMNNSNFEMTGGQFTAPDTSLNSSAYIDVYEGNFDISGATQFLANNGLIKMRSRNLWADTVTYNFNAGTFPLFDLEFGDEGGHHNIINTVTVTRDLILRDGSCSSCTFGVMTNGIIEVGRNINMFYYAITGNTTIRVVGSGDHIINGSTYDPGQIPSLEFDTTGSVTLLNKIYSKTKFKIFNAGPWNALASKVVLAMSGNNQTFDLVHGGYEFGDLVFSGCGATHNVTGTLIVKGKLTLDGASSGACGFQKVNGGEIQAYGDADFVGYGNTGNVALTFMGPTASSIFIASSHAARFAKGLVTIAKANGVTVTLNTTSSNWSLSAAGQGFNMASGILDLNGKSLSINGNLDLPVNSEIIKNGGILTYSSITPALGSGGTISP